MSARFDGAYERVEVRAMATRTGVEPFTGAVAKKGQVIVVRDELSIMGAFAVVELIRERHKASLGRPLVMVLRAGATEWEAAVDPVPEA